MVWGVIYHPEVQDDLDSIGTAEARRIFKVTEDRIINGSPDKTGNPFPGFIPTDRINPVHSAPFSCDGASAASA